MSSITTAGGGVACPTALAPIKNLLAISMMGSLKTASSTEKGKNIFLTGILIKVNT